MVERKTLDLLAGVQFSYRVLGSRSLVRFQLSVITMQGSPTSSYAFRIMVVQQIPNLLAWVRFLQGVPMRNLKPVDAVILILGILFVCGGLGVFLIGNQNNVDNPPSINRVVPTLTTTSTSWDPLSEDSYEDEDELLMVVHPGAFCDNIGQKGKTKTGKSMTCKGPGSPRWRR